MTQDPVLIVDGSACLYRNRYRIEKETEEITIFALAKSFLYSLSYYTSLSQKFSRAFILFDKDSSFRRREYFPDYKKHREKNEDKNKGIQDACALFLSKHFVKLGLSSVIVPGLEADDVAYYLTQQYPVGIMVAEDHDWFLNLQAGWKIFFPKKKTFFAFEDLCDFVGTTENPHLVYLFYKSLLGDPSDGISGVKGIGKKKALPLAKKILYEDYSLDEEAREILSRNCALMSPFWAKREVRIYETVDSVLERTEAASFFAWLSFASLFPEKDQEIILSFWPSFSGKFKGVTCLHQTN